LEIERKWILKEFPETISEDCCLVGHYSVDQFYVNLEPAEVRLRRVVTYFGPRKSQCELAIKSSNDGLMRTEIETEVSQTFYEDAKLFINKAPIRKDYYIFKHGDYKLEVSKVENKFIYAEVEFETEEEAEAYELPIEDAVEVTEEENSKWKMANYWKATRLCDCDCQNLDYSYPVKEITASGEDGIVGGDFESSSEDLKTEASAESGIAGGDFGL
jgi:CYTH domain-containing protein